MNEKGRKWERNKKRITVMLSGLTLEEKNKQTNIFNKPQLVKPPEIKL